MSHEWPALVADIGGTNARFAMVDAPGASLRQVLHLKTGDYPGLFEAMSDYLGRIGETAHAACVAVAGPVLDDKITFPNNPFAFSVAETRRRAGTPIEVVNDLAAYATALPHLPDDELILLGGGAPAAGRPKIALGPGTGLGAAALMPNGEDWLAVPGETGHIDLPVVEDIEIEVLKFIRRERGRVSVESVLSGPGLQLLRSALAAVQALPAPPIEISELTRLATAPDGDPLCRQTLSVFCALLGGVAGNLALTFGAMGGVYLGGGIPPRFPDFIKQSDFRKRFEAKGRMRALLERIPAFVITGHNVALRGAAVRLVSV